MPEPATDLREAIHKALEDTPDCSEMGCLDHCCGGRCDSITAQTDAVLSIIERETAERDTKWRSTVEWERKCAVADALDAAIERVKARFEADDFQIPLQSMMYRLSPTEVAEYVIASALAAVRGDDA